MSKESATHVSLAKSKLNRWIELMEQGPENIKLVQLEMIFEIDGYIATGLVNQTTTDKNLPFEVRDFKGVITRHAGMIAAIKHIRAETGWGLLMAKRWCDIYCVDTRTHDEYGRPRFVPEDGYKDEDDQPSSLFQ